MIKPDGVQRGLVGEIIARFERKGLKLIGMKFVSPTREHLEEVGFSAAKHRTHGWLE